MRTKCAFFFLLVLITAGMFFMEQQVSAGPPQHTPDEQALKSLAALRPVDVHVHVFKSDPAFQTMLDRLHLNLMNILVMDDTLPYRKELQSQIDDAWKLVRSSKGHVAFCTTFDPYKFNDPNFPKEALRQIERDFEDGAIAVKIWKNIGMEITNANGKYIMPDDPKFAPIYATIQKRGKTLMSHVAEPNVAWGPADQATLRGPITSKIRNGWSETNQDSPRKTPFSKRAITSCSRIRNSAWWACTWEAWRKTWTASPNASIVIRTLPLIPPRAWNT
jgi:hypothetical protein